MRPSDRLQPNDAELTEPWHAEALALAIALVEVGHITQAKWSSTLNDEIETARAAGDPADGMTYYTHVLASLERLVAEQGLLTAATLGQRRLDWAEAYRRTPHGKPVTLTPKTSG